MARLNLEYLNRVCTTPLQNLKPRPFADLLADFGWLAPWWLAREVRERAAREVPGYGDLSQTPELPRESGGCWGVFYGNPRFPLLAPALLLPLRWKEGSHAENLPGALVDLAQQVVEQVDPGAAWGLHLDQPAGHAPVDLRYLEDQAIGVKSAWASLVGGLELMRNNGCPDPEIWASIAWDEEVGAGRVEGLDLKLDLARDRGATHVFVSAQNLKEVRHWYTVNRESKMKVELLAAPLRGEGPLTPAQVLARYLQRLETEPGPDAPFDHRKDFYKGLTTDRPRADGYYWRRLLPDVIGRCRATLPEPIRAAAPTHVVTVVSNLLAVVSMATSVLNAERCLLFHEASDAKIQQNLKQICEFLQARGVEIVPAPLTLGDRISEMAQMRKALGKFLATVPEGKVACDLTPGFRNLSQQLEEIAPVGAWLLYCRHRQLPPDNRVEPDSERYDAWRKGQSSSS